MLAICRRNDSSRGPEPLRAASWCDRAGLATTFELDIFLRAPAFTLHREHPGVSEGGAELRFGRPGPNHTGLVGSRLLSSRSRFAVPRADLPSPCRVPEFPAVWADLWSQVRCRVFSGRVDLVAECLGDGTYRRTAMMGLTAIDVTTGATHDHAAGQVI